MNTFDRLFIGAAGGLLLTALVARTVAQTPASEAVSGATNAVTTTLQSPARGAVSAPAAAATAVAAKPSGARPPVKASVAKPATAASAAKGGAPAPLPPVTPAMARKEGDIIIRNSPQGSAIYDEKRDIAHITKDVRVRQEGEDFVLYCQTLTYDRGANRALATGDVKIVGRDTTITGTRLQADFARKVVVLTGNVDVRSRGKGDGLKSDNAPLSRSKPSRMQCDRVEYDYGTRDAVITGHILLSQEGATGTCDRILFDEENNIVTLQDNARFTNAQGQILRGPVVKIWLDSGMAKADRVEIRSPGASQTPVPRATKQKPEDAPVLPSDLLEEAGRTPAPAPSAAPPPAPETPDSSPETPAPDPEN